MRSLNVGFGYRKEIKVNLSIALMKKSIYVSCIFLSAAVTGCSQTKEIARSAQSIILSDTSIAKGHVGIKVIEPATGKTWYSYQADQYFLPASNTKLFSLYAGLKYLGDSIPTLEVTEFADNIQLRGLGDPTFLHPEYPGQPGFERLKQLSKPLFYATPDHFRTTPYGSGWGWDDYESTDMLERAALPVYGNMLAVKGKAGNAQVTPTGIMTGNLVPLGNGNQFITELHRSFHENSFSGIFNSKSDKSQYIPFITSVPLAWKLLGDTLHTVINPATNIPASTPLRKYTIYSRPVDSMYKYMMLVSENFFAEQTLLMASERFLGYMDDHAMIDTLLKTDLKGIPQQPRWVDGSGLSRYNLFTPSDMIFILQKLQDSFGLDRMKRILLTGGQGTLRNYYKEAAGFIYAKTGSLSNNVALSGFLYTKKNKLLLFSIMIGNYPTGGYSVRKLMEEFLLDIRNKY